MLTYICISVVHNDMIIYIGIVYVCTYAVYLQRTGNAATQLTKEEIQAGIHKTNEQTIEALECEYAFLTPTLCKCNALYYT